MSESKKPHIKLMVTRDMFNTMLMMFEFFIASEAQAGETFYSITSAKFMSQFVKYGNFNVKKNESDSLFVIYLYESEVVKIMRLYNKYISVHQQPYKNYFAEFKQKKS
jgi:hypothetical protein